MGKKLRKSPYREYLNMISMNMSPINLRSSSVNKSSAGLDLMIGSFLVASKLGSCMNSPKSADA